jgi:hypothetical protein
MKKNHRITIAVFLSVLFLALMSTGIAFAADAAIEVKGSGIPGKSFEVAGTHFAPGEVVELELLMDGLPIIVGKKGKAITAGDDGTFTGKTNYPHKLVAVPGTWELTATGDKGSKATCKIEIKSP